ncbi:hypothetical protein G7046_g1587 [Stylonectria norvegica]|nr:hypothetical protein G7046_g1587 [Stylonectria norvegica]
MLRPARHVAHQLTHLQHRCFSITSSPYSKATASEAASHLLENFADKSIARRQLIDGNQLQKLALTLGRPSINGIDISDAPPPPGTPVPAGHHLVYFTPNGTEEDLGADGTDRIFNASAPFTRRMWAGGRMTWPTEAKGSGSLLRVGDEVEERTRLLSATAKKSRSASEMVLVEVEKEIWGPRGLALVDRRSWVFRPEVDSKVVGAAPKLLEGIIRGPSVVKDLPSTENDFPVRQLRWSPVGLFRFSALTFNGHMIHYSEDWTRNVENHPGVVVHGPLNLINLLNYWGDIHGKGESPKQISYRAMSPLYAGETYQIRTDTVRDVEGGRAWELLVEKDGEIECSSCGDIHFHPENRGQEFAISKFKTVTELGCDTAMSETEGNESAPIKTEVGKRVMTSPPRGSNETKAEFILILILVLVLIAKSSSSQSPLSYPFSQLRR